jgi:hypothetical protein
MRNENRRKIMDAIVRISKSNSEIEKDLHIIWQIISKDIKEI